MNRERLESIRIRLRREASSDFYGDRAATVFEMAYILDALLDTDDQAPTPKVDSSLRGWVVVEGYLNGPAVLWADCAGIHEGQESGGARYDWSDIPTMGWTIRPLTPADVDGYDSSDVMDIVTNVWESTAQDADMADFHEAAVNRMAQMRRDA